MGIDETGVVIDSSDNRAWIRIEDGGDCSACASPSCRREEDASSPRIVEAINLLGVQPGQRVELHIESAGILKASLLMYALPLLFLLLGAIFGKSLDDGENPSDALAVIFGLGLMGAGFLGVRIYNKRAAQREEFYPRITRILG